MTTSSIKLLAAAIALTTCGCAAPIAETMPPRATGGYHLNDNGYLTYYSTENYPNADCRNNMTSHCRDRLERNWAYCSAWSDSGRCGELISSTQP